MEQDQTSSEIKEYFSEIDEKIRVAHELATKARKKGYDPEDKIDIPLASNMAERVIGLISAIAPQIVNTTITKRIAELEKQYGALDWRISLIIAEEIAKEKYCKFKDKKEAIEIGIRVGFAYHTLGTVASPLEGFSEIKFIKTKEGKDCFSLYFSGPIRSAGGTGASVSVLIADYVRKKLGYAAFDPEEKEIKRYVSELYDYHERVTNLQYLPSPEEIEFLGKHIPVQIAGDPSEKIEVSNYKDLPRVETNKIRNGVCLVLGEGIAQKAPKLWKQLSKWGKEFDMDQWNFLEEFIHLQKKIKAGGKKEQKKEENEGKEEQKPKVSPDLTFIKDLVAGRPVLTHPLAVGGFRLRYGRARTSGYSSNAIHPLTMQVLNKYIAVGTQLKTERPGKGCTVSSCDSIDGPIIKLKGGSVVRPKTEQELKIIENEISEILFLGDILISYGDFLNRAHPLIPPGYCEEWWVQELERSIVDTFGSLDIEKLSELVDVPKLELEMMIKEPFNYGISAQRALLISEKLNIPLHPYYTFYWKTVTKDKLLELLSWLERSNIKKEKNELNKIILPLKESPKRVLELLGIPHLVVNNEFVVIEKQEATILLSNLSSNDTLDIQKLVSVIGRSDKSGVLDIINGISKVRLRDKAGIFIGARMGRPEKAKMRKLTGSPQVLFPVGSEGGRLRCFQSALETGKVTGDFPLYYCKHCDRQTVFGVCDLCDKKTKRVFFCKLCGLIDTEICTKHGQAEKYKKQELDIKSIFSNLLKKIGAKTYPDLIKGIKGTSNKEHVPEHLLKGIIRAKHDIFVNKDGTTRYDMTQMPLTHFKPKEIRTPIEKLKRLGYKQDIFSRPLENKDQILELKPQDIIIPACQDSPDEGSDVVLFRVAKMCDELLEQLYCVPSFYNLKSPEDLAGHLVLILAPHTSAAITGRIIGFSNTQGFLAHPMIHAATRRDCDGDEASISLIMDAFLNFSRQYLPAHKGSKQDAPLVLTSRLVPAEIDDMVFDLDVVWKYPLEFYESCIEYKNPWDVDIETLGKRLGTPKQYQEMGFTHDTRNINKGVVCSAYKTLPSMEEKLKGQMDIAEKVRAVNTSDVARLVIEKHFIRDTKGNLRKFSMQQFRCVKCNEKFRRPPLTGKCTKCRGKIIFTISEGSVIKYLEPSISIAEKYNVPSYIKQSLELLKRRIEDVFGKEKEKQTGLGSWFG